MLTCSLIGSAKIKKMRILLHPFNDKQNMIVRRFLLAAIAEQIKTGKILKVDGDEESYLNEMLSELKQQLN